MCTKTDTETLDSKNEKNGQEQLEIKQKQNKKN